MKFYVTDKVFEKLPEACFGLVSVCGVDNSADYPFIGEMLDENIISCRDYFAGKTVKEEKELAPYRDAFKTLGINPNKFMSSIEALLTRIAKNKGMPHINPIVDLGNAISLKYYLPVGAHDLDTMEGDFCVRTADSEDTFLPFGAREREPVDEGEVVYATGKKVRTRRYSELARTLATMPEDEESEGSGVSLLAMLLDAFHHNTLNALSLPKDRQPRGERLEKAAKSSKQERRKNDGRKDKKRQDGSRDASRDASRGPSADTPQADGETAPAAPAENGVQAEETAPARQKGQGKKKKKSGSGSAKSAGKNAQDKPKKSSRPIFLGNDAGLQDETPVTPESQGMESPSAAQDRSDKKKTSRKRKRRHKKGPSEGQEAGMHASEAQGNFDDMEVPF